MCHHIGPVYAPWVRLAILTGLRRGEQLKLTWQDIDFEQGLICLPKTKAGGVQYVPLNDEAKAILRQLCDAQLERGRVSEWVFAKNPLRPIRAASFYRNVFMPAVRAAGLQGVTWHTLRHTFASRLAMRGHNPNTIADLLRHSSLAPGEAIRAPLPGSLEGGGRIGRQFPWNRNNVGNTRGGNGETLGWERGL